MRWAVQISVRKIDASRINDENGSGSDTTTNLNERVRAIYEECI